MVIERQVSAAAVTSWRAGGTIGELLLPGDVVELQQMLAENPGRVLPILGRGTNLLIADGPHEEPVLSLTRMPEAVDPHIDECGLVVSAATRLPRVARLAARLGLTGFEFLAGIPGSMGGGIVMNAGTGGLDGPCIADRLEWADVLTEGSSGVVRMTAAELGFGYRASALQGRSALVLRAFLRAEGVGNPQSIRRSIEERLAARRRKQPLRASTAGSTFLPAAGAAAATWIERAGLKGAAVGGAQVSTKHVNWIETSRSCSASDVRELIDLIERAVIERCGVRLEREVQYFPLEATRVSP